MIPGEDESGVGLVSRRHGRVVGFALHERPAATVLVPAEVAALLDPAPGATREPTGNQQGAPSISVAVCTGDRTELLGRCLEGLRSLVPPPHEIVVVDNAASYQGSRCLVAVLAGVRYQVEPCPGLDLARTGSCSRRPATGEVVAFVDDDVVVDGAGWPACGRPGWSTPNAGVVTRPNPSLGAGDRRTGG